MDKNQDYILKLMENNNITIEELRSYAEKHHVPIVDKISLETIKQLIRIHQPKSILEIGTAIGYSAMQFASLSSKIHVTTIERDKDMLQAAKNNIKYYGYEHQITLIDGDAREQFDRLKNYNFDMLFIDAAKAQTRKFFELYTPLLGENGLVVTDNILYHGHVANIENVQSRNLRRMVKKIQDYNKWLMNNNNFNTHFLNIDDGLAISIKKEQLDD
ncbi:O-methyltransferase [Staphylococcus sp. SQ8-PEA]|uniref:tRNA 5-hydroxyuridine methyltransferase n=1 Tax=Staphylococcus marylandisciuri TaxID=2981529 RepID=A0ABT2QR23_9STAP|nr:O-methyltransferase [Staphylococcus marylandisciuri]MCU5746428.1 O-methyltransferase [Staphylococcus marylandisciuri]